MTISVDEAPQATIWPERVVFACSSGGHLAQLERLRPWWETRERQWSTFDTMDARSILHEEEVVWVYSPTTRNVPNLLRNIRLARRQLRSYRPDLVISNGAGVAVAYFLMAKALKIPCVYIEVLDRIDSRTLTGRLCAPMSDLFLVQVPQQQGLYPGSVVVGELL